MLQGLLGNLRSYLDTFFDALSFSQAEAILEKLAACKGTLFLTGVGKSGHIAQKVAATFVSTGTKASFLCPTNALHGDLGIASSQDLFLFFSKSGESEELLQLLPPIRNRGAQMIAIVSAENSRLAKEADLSIVLPVEREICPYDLAPTTSTIVQLIFGDCLAMALMQKKQFSLLDFASNHPAGLIGRKISFKVSDLMLRGTDLPLCKKSDRLIDRLHELSIKKCGCLLIEEGGRLEGIFTDGDLRRTIERLGEKGLTSTMEELMNPAPRSIAPQLLALEALQRMEENPSRPITVLPVVSETRVVGLVRMHDIIQAGLSK